MRFRSFIWGTLFVSAVLVSASAWEARVRETPSASEAPPPALEPATAGHAPPHGAPHPDTLVAGDPDPLPRDLDPRALRWIAAGGGLDPASNQRQIEQDLVLARRTFGPEGVVLFGAGPGSQGVQVLDPEPRGDALVARLGRIFDPRAGRDAHYQRVVPEVDGPADAGVLLDLLEQAVAAPGPAPLVVYLAGHGEGGATPRDVLLRLWGGWSLSPADLGAVLEGTRRPVRLVVTSCFSGGFAEVAFTGADPAAGPTDAPVCGWFATTWDREASGCDPQPERARQEGYGLHLLSALAGRDRDGRPLAPEDIDFDGDGQVSFEEAHARARITDGGLDVPTATWERVLRATVSADAPDRGTPTPIEDAVIAGLEQALDLRGETAARRAQARLSSRLEHTRELLDEARAEADDAWYVLTAALLARWPVLDDPWHPDFDGVVAAHHAGITGFLDRSPEARHHARAQDTADELGALLDRLILEDARIERLVRAYVNRRLLRRAPGPVPCHG